MLRIFREETVVHLVSGSPRWARSLPCPRRRPRWPRGNWTGWTPAGRGNGDAMALVADNQHTESWTGPRRGAPATPRSARGSGETRRVNGPPGGRTASMGIWTLADDEAGDQLYAGK